MPYHGNDLRSAASINQLIFYRRLSWKTVHQQISLFLLKLDILHCESKKQTTIILSITSPNIDRFSKFFSLSDSLANVQQNRH